MILSVLFGDYSFHKFHLHISKSIPVNKEPATLEHLTEYHSIVI